MVSETFKKEKYGVGLWLMLDFQLPTKKYVALETQMLNLQHLIDDLKHDLSNKMTHSVSAAGGLLI